MKLNSQNFIFDRLQTIAALMLSFAIMSFGHGLLNTVIGLRANAENYSDIIVGLMTSGYFLGFILGTIVCGKLVPRVGHIRCFAIFASVASALTLAFVIHVHPLTWILVRVIYGACMAALYMVMESWLNLICKNEERGQILAFYMITNALGIALSQGFIMLSSPNSFTLFAIASLLLSISLVPVAASRTPQPQEIATGKFTLKELVRTSHLATLGIFTTGAINGSFWGFGPIYLSDIGMPDDRVGGFISALYIGGLVMQWPIGYLSDRIDRRGAIVSMLFLSSVVSFYLYLMEYNDSAMVYGLFLIGAFFFGGINNTLHSLFLSLANDYLQPHQVVKASGGLLTVHASGAIIGPVIAAFFIHMLGASGLMFYTSAFALVIFIYAVYRYTVGRPIPERTRGSFIPIPRTGINIGKLDPRRIIRRPPSA